MGFEYALVHLKYNIPPAIVLTFIYRPFVRRIDVYKILFLIAIAVVSTIPWDSYLIKRKIWTYPPNVIIGPKLFLIPAEELFFFVIQTYNTSLLYLLLSKPVFHSAYLGGWECPGEKKQKAWGSLVPPVSLKSARSLGQLILGSLILTGGFLIVQNARGTYLGLILAWAGPFALLLWSLSHEFLMRLPYTATLLPIAASTLYLWIVDTLALKRGTWSIETGTKLGLHLWDGLEIEEAVFFLATNILIVFGLVAFDHALAILFTFPDLFPTVPECPSPKMLVCALLTDTCKYDNLRIAGIQEAVELLRQKSRSFYLASSVFHGRLRIDLILLYSFCRVADDLVDDANTDSEAREWIAKLTHYLDLVYASKETANVAASCRSDVDKYIQNSFPPSLYRTLRLLPTHILSPRPLYELLEGFKTDLEFHQANRYKNTGEFPIRDEHNLTIYSRRVAGTVAEMCLELAFYHTSAVVLSHRRDELIRAGARMGIALQYINICRDVATDAAIGRVYLPSSWLEEEGLQPQHIVENPTGPIIDKLRGRLLNKGFAIYQEARPAIEQVPEDARVSMRVAVESYVEIGRVLKENEYKVAQGRATVPKLRRIGVAWKALRQG
ncbi:Bcphs1 [Botrytis cinerea B05.10]|uniref:Bifunctional lycopene cyclase/phytoene synthase n=2 Tax=Botryotinia fuckeliana TaxID=40559 RepID=A0A384J5F0_BOTFB|nr:Bcphs1 [Botrytis cinerea B05.10]ATZ45729.1 Bcphs1 [Botrytis cinerea B05.10]EMR86131.1 putative phytoene synthase lycopene cyclase protein [Botrytis cinerea BcDW1]